MLLSTNKSDRGSAIRHRSTRRDVTRNDNAVQGQCRQVWTLTYNGRAITHSRGVFVSPTIAERINITTTTPYVILGRLAFSIVVPKYKALL